MVRLWLRVLQVVMGGEAQGKFWPSKCLMIESAALTAVCVTRNGWYRKQACLDSSKQFPPESAHKCRGGYSFLEYPWLTEEIFCCRDADFCNHKLMHGGSTPPHSQQKPTTWVGMGQNGGEGKDTTSPTSYHITQTFLLIIKYLPAVYTLQYRSN